MIPEKPIYYLDKTQLPYLFCPGCGHGKILDSLNQALDNLSINPQRLVIITDIGCAGLSDKYFRTNAFHGLHGRSVTYATGIKLANPELKIIVLIGDGGCGIGGHHIINAARRNVGLTMIVFNNLNYGMTGGEHSVTTPPGRLTATTPQGQLEHPLDICGTVALNGASFVARTTTFEKTVPDIITKAIKNDGFSLVDVWELCTAHFAANNRFGKKELYQTLEALSFPTGILQEKSLPEFSTAYRRLNHQVRDQPSRSSQPISTRYASNLEKPFRMILAGAAGAKIVSAASLFAKAAIRAGLWVSQRDDYPVMVKSGHSISELILSPDRVMYAGIENPDLVIALFPEGLEKCAPIISRLTEKDKLMISDDLPMQASHPTVIPLQFQGHKKEKRAIMALTAMLKHYKLFPLEALREALAADPKFAQENLDAFQAGLSLYAVKSQSQ